MNRLSIFVLPIVGAFATGCAGSSTPDCGDPATTSIVKQIIEDAMRESLDSNREMFESMAESFGFSVDPEFDNFELRLGNVRTQSRDDSIDKYACRGDLVLTREDYKEDHSLRYTSERNAEGEHYVEIQHLTDEKIGEFIGAMMLIEDEG